MKIDVHHNNNYIQLLSSNVPKCKLNNANIDHYASINRTIIVYYETKKTNALWANALVIVYLFPMSVVFAMLTTH